ncbi:MAG: hypothetical protein KF754_06655 [Planctomycetes bacterium]|nr:hypothetical protein [Planctomycetota bacterium]
MPERKSIRESLRMEGRDWSLLAAAAALVAFGLALNNSIIPNYHEHQAMLKRHTELKQQLEVARQEGAQLQDEIDALDDPYYLSSEMIEKYHWRYAPPATPATPK